MLFRSSGDVEIHLTKNQISFSAENLYLTSRVVDGAFPDYKQILPKTFSTEVTMLKEDFSSALKLATIFGDKFNHLTITADPEKKLFTLYSKNADVGEHRDSVAATLKGEALEVGFNYKYLADCLQSIEADSVSLSFNGQGKPLVVRGISDKTFTYLVMPMNR